MPIEFHCSHCGKLVRAPDTAGGRRGRCPYCEQSVYIPTPLGPEDEVPLAPEDSGPDPEERAAAEIDRQLQREMRSAPEGAVPEPSAPETALPDIPVASGEDVETQVFDFIRAMSESNLPRADEIAAGLARSQREAIEVIERLSMDAVPPPELGNLPPAVYQGFLRTLRNRI